MVLRYTPTKTQTTTGKAVVVDLRACPMVMEEIERIPQDARSGPLIVNRRTGLPYSDTTFKDVWRDARKAAGIPEGVWNRDLRKSGSTEARAAGAAIDDLQKLMGHAEGSKVTATVYDQAALEAHRRIAQARAGHRGKKGIVNRTGDRKCVLIQESGDLLMARLKASMAGFDGEFVEAHRLDPKMVQLIPKTAVGRVLSLQEAERVLKRLSRPKR